MRNSNQSPENQASNNGSRIYDPAAGTVIDADTGEVLEQQDITEQELFGTGEGPQSDGTIVLPKITAATIRCNPERSKIADKPVKMMLVTGIVGGEYLMPPVDREMEFQSMPETDIQRMTFTALVAGGGEPWGTVRFDDEGEPNAVFKSDFLFLPISHIAVITRYRRRGPVPIALEFWSQPATNVRGYSWSMYNLAKYDGNVSPIDRLLIAGVRAGKQLQLVGRTAGLLSDLRNT